MLLFKTRNSPVFKVFFGSGLHDLYNFKIDFSEKFNSSVKFDASGICGDWKQKAVNPVNEGTIASTHYRTISGFIT